MKVFVALLSVAALAVGAPHIESDVYDVLADGPKTVIVNFHGTPVSKILNDYSAAYSAEFRTTDYDLLPSLLKENAAKSQASTLAVLESRKAAKSSGSSYFQLWTMNKLVIDDADLDLIQALQGIPEISSIEADKVVVQSPEVYDSRPAGNISALSVMQRRNEWGVEDVKAPEVWNRGNKGAGVVVGIIDTGVRPTHIAINEQYRENYGWFDAIQGRGKAYDDNGHGTHCIGSVLGRYGLGVAPDAQWIACKGLSAQSGGTNSQLLKCGQFMYCPTDPSGNNEDCTRRPKIVSNSWGTNAYTNFYNDMINLWINANMIGIFSNGNNGRNGCNTVGSPASYEWAIGVGSTNRNNRVSDYSSRGPIPNGRNNYIKPDVSAPGEDITSADYRSDNGLQTMSGTSMAAPHISGIVALWCSTNPDLNQETAWRALVRGTVRTQSLNQQCANKRDSDYPNNQVGYGKVQAPSFYN